MTGFLVYNQNQLVIYGLNGVKKYEGELGGTIRAIVPTSSDTKLLVVLEDQHSADKIKIMELFDIIGIVIIVAAALKGGRRGFVITLGRLCAGILSLLLVYLLNTWAFAQLVPTLLVDHQVIIVRVLLCVVLYIVLFLVLKTIILSLRILTGLPIIKG